MADKSLIARRALYAVCAALIIGEFIIHRHAYFALEAMPLFFVALGAVSFAFALIGGRLLHIIVSRNNDYYGKQDDV